MVQNSIPQSGNSIGMGSFCPTRIEKNARSPVSRILAALSQHNLSILSRKCKKDYPAKNSKGRMGFIIHNIF